MKRLPTIIRILLIFEAAALILEIILNAKLESIDGFSGFARGRDIKDKTKVIGSFGKD